MKKRTQQDGEIKDRIAGMLKQAVDDHPEGVEHAAKLLQIRLGTLYKYMSGSMIPGGQVLWRACEHLGLVLDRNGLRVPARRAVKLPSRERGPAQYTLPFIDESVAGDKVDVHVRRKDSQYVQVKLRIKIAG